jgi:transposase
MGRKSKYSYEFKLQCVEAVLKGHRSVTSIAKEGGFEDSNLRLWIGFYQEYGRSGLKPKVNRQYDAGFKLHVIETIDKEYLSLRQACVRFNIPSESVIIGWRRAYESKGQAGLLPQPKGRPKKMKQLIKRKPRKSAKPLTREEELLLENEYLRAENELLKKLQALAQTRKKQKP